MELLARSGSASAGSGRPRRRKYNQILSAISKRVTIKAVCQIARGINRGLSKGSILPFHLRSFSKYGVRAPRDCQGTGIEEDVVASLPKFGARYRSPLPAVWWRTTSCLEIGELLPVIGVGRAFAVLLVPYCLHHLDSDQRDAFPIQTRKQQGGTKGRAPILPVCPSFSTKDGFQLAGSRQEPGGLVRFPASSSFQKPEWMFAKNNRACGNDHDRARVRRLLNHSCWFILSTF